MKAVIFWRKYICSGIFGRGHRNFPRSVPASWWGWSVGLYCRMLGEKQENSKVYGGERIWKWHCASGKLFLRKVRICFVVVHWIIFIFRLYKIVENLKLKRKPIFWQEVFDNNIPDPNAVIHIWKGNTHEEIYEQVKNITSQNFPVIVSACWYLNYIKYGADWRDEIRGTAPSNSRYQKSTVYYNRLILDTTIVIQQTSMERWRRRNWFGVVLLQFGES